MFFDVLRNRFFIALAAFAVLGFVAWRGYREVVPEGTELAYYAKTASKQVTSPDLNHTLEVVAGEASPTVGARPPIWIVERSLLTGAKVVAKGFVPTHQTHEAVELKWVGDHTFQVEFAQSRDGEGIKTVTVDLK